MEEFTMKRIISILLLSTLLTLSLAIPVSAAPIRVLVNNVLIKFPDAQPFIDANGRTQVPARFVSEALGGTVNWNGDNGTVTITRGTDTITLKVGEQTITLNGTTKQLDTAALIKQERTFVPLRFVSEALGAGITWEAPIMTAKITTNQVVAPGATVVSKGYTIPLGTKLGFFPDSYDPGKDVEQSFDINFLLPDPEAQKVALRSAISSKFGEAIGTEVYNHVLSKKARWDKLPEKIIFSEPLNQYIYIVASGGGLIEIYIYRPGKDPSNLGGN